MAIIFRPAFDAPSDPPPPSIPASGRVRVDVTENDIAQGCNRNAVGCPVSYAVARAVGAPLCAVWADGAWSTFAPPRSGKLPPDVVARVNLYDRVDEIAPFSFDLDVGPQPARATHN